MQTQPFDASTSILKTRLALALSRLVILSSLFSLSACLRSGFTNPPDASRPTLQADAGTQDSRIVDAVAEDANLADHEISDRNIFDLITSDHGVATDSAISDLRSLDQQAASDASRDASMDDASMDDANSDDARLAEDGRMDDVPLYDGQTDDAHINDAAGDDGPLADGQIDDAQSSTLPTVSIVSIDNSGARQQVDVLIFDQDSDPVELILEVSVDTGQSFKLISCDSSSPCTNLSSSPAGTAHQVSWDLLQQLGFRVHGQATLRVSARDPSGTGAAVTQIFTIPSLRQEAMQRVQHHAFYYGLVDNSIRDWAKNYDLVVLHPANGNLSRNMVQSIGAGWYPNDPADDVIVLCYLSICEDPRTLDVADAELHNDARFVGDGSGPRVDPRGPNADRQSLEGIDPLGSASNITGLASYYLDDVSVDNNGQGDGLPDRNTAFGVAYVNAGAPAWYKVVDAMNIDQDGESGIQEILSTDFGRGMACDGLFIDTVDAAAPNSFTNTGDNPQAEFEWTAPGVTNFIQRLRDDHSDSFLLLNRGLFFFSPDYPHFAFSPRALIDGLLFESYRLDSASSRLFNVNSFAENRNNILPQLMAQAQGEDGFKILSLGYAEGPDSDIQLATLNGGSELGLSTLFDEVDEAQNFACMPHFITNADIDERNDFVFMYSDPINPQAHWSSTYNDHDGNPAGEPSPRLGLQRVQILADRAYLRWDVALAMPAVFYKLYYQQGTLDPAHLELAQTVTIKPQANPAYAQGRGAAVYPFAYTLDNLQVGQSYSFLLRSATCAESTCEDNNSQIISTRDPGSIDIDGAFSDWSGVAPLMEDANDVPDSTGPDWKSIWISHDAQNLYISASSANSFNLDGSPDNYSRLLIMFDLDNDDSTGYAESPGMGSKLLISGDHLYREEAGSYNAGDLGTVQVQPQSNVTRLEFAIPLSIIETRFAGARDIRILFINDKEDDFAPDTGSLPYSLLP